jgi:hypothetical protein
VDTRAPPPATAEARRALHEALVPAQKLNNRFKMPAAVVFQALSWWLVQRFPQAMLERGGHLVLIVLTLAFSLHYLHGGIRLLRRRERWLLFRAGD